MDQEHLDINARPYLKNRKRAEDVAQVAQWLPTKHKALSSNHSITKKRREGRTGGIVQV
jgi:hypothetical protein